MAKVVATDGSLPAFAFEVDFGNNLKVGFSEISGLKQETEEILYRNGDEATRQHKLRGLTTFEDITLKQGLLRDPALIPEAFKTFSIANGKKQVNEYVFDNVVIKQLDLNGETALEWHLENAWISSFELDTYDSNTSAIQFLTVMLKHEGLKLVRK